jgi:hypothetical protein
VFDVKNFMCSTNDSVGFLIFLVLGWTQYTVGEKSLEKGEENGWQKEIRSGSMVTNSLAV